MINIVILKLSFTAGYADFVSLNASLQFPPGTAEQSISLYLIDDVLVEAAEFF